jgi:hypothetical protein
MCGLGVRGFSRPVGEGPTSLTLLDMNTKWMIRIQVLTQFERSLILLNIRMNIVGYEYKMDGSHSGLTLNLKDSNWYKLLDISISCAMYVWSHSVISCHCRTRCTCTIGRLWIEEYTSFEKEKGNTSTLTSGGWWKNRTAYSATARPPWTRVPPRESSASHEMTLSFRLHSLLLTIFYPSRSLLSLMQTMEGSSTSDGHGRPRPSPCSSGGGEAERWVCGPPPHPSPPPADSPWVWWGVSRWPDGSGRSWAAPAGGALFRRGSDHPARGSGRPRHGSGGARRWLAPEWWGEGGRSAGLSVAALCHLPPRGVAGSLLASPVDAPLPVMGGSLLLALFIWDLIFFDVAITVYRCCNRFLRMLHCAYRCCLNVLWMLEYTRF